MLVVMIIITIHILTYLYSFGVTYACINFIIHPLHRYLPSCFNSAVTSDKLNFRKNIEFSSSYFVVCIEFYTKTSIVWAIVLFASLLYRMRLLHYKYTDIYRSDGTNVSLNLPLRQKYKKKKKKAPEKLAHNGYKIL